MSSAVEFYQKGPAVWSFAVIFIIWDCWTNSQFTLDLTHCDVTVMITKSYHHEANHVIRDWEVNKVSCHGRAHLTIAIWGYPAKRALSAMHKYGGLGPFGRIPSLSLLINSFWGWKLKEPPKLLVTSPPLPKLLGPASVQRPFLPRYWDSHNKSHETILSLLWDPYTSKTSSL